MEKSGLTFFKCLFAHLVKVFFWMASRSSEREENEIELKYFSHGKTNVYIETDLY